MRLKQPPAFLLMLFSLAFAVPTALAEDHASPAGRRLRERLERTDPALAVTSDLEIAIVPGCLDESRAALHKNLAQGDAVPFDALTEAFIDEHAKRTPEFARAELDSVLGLMRTGVDRSDLHRMKTDYEAKLKLHFKKDLVYNKHAVTLGELCKANKMQCYSGTSLNQVITRKVLAADGFAAKNPVVIYEEGHILPGYMVPDGDGWKLVGIETTAEGLARVDYGRTDQLQGGQVRVVDAGHWLLSEIFKDCLSHPIDLAQSILDQTARRYGILDNRPFGTQDEPDGAQASGASAPSGAADSGPKMNQSIFAFGNPSVRDGDIRRVPLERKTRSTLGHPSQTTERGEAIVPPPKKPKAPSKKKWEIPGGGFYPEDHGPTIPPAAKQGLSIHPSPVIHLVDQKLWYFVHSKLIIPGEFSKEDNYEYAGPERWVRRSLVSELFKHHKLEWTFRDEQWVPRSPVLSLLKELAAHNAAPTLRLELDRDGNRHPDLQILDHLGCDKPTMEAFLAFRPDLDGVVEYRRVNPNAVLKITAADRIEALMATRLAFEEHTPERRTPDEIAQQAALRESCLEARELLRTYLEKR